MSDKCINTYTHQCKLSKYGEYNECILHCTKETLSSLSNPYFKDYDLFFDSLIEYILEDVLRIKNDDTNFTKENLVKYFSLTDIQFQELQKHEDLSDSANGIEHTVSETTEVLKYLLKYFQDTKIVFSKIHFPNTDDRDVPNYEYILSKLGKIHFNYCSFYITSLDLENTECFFQDCDFYEYWSLTNFKVEQELDDLEVYNTCTFHEDVSGSGADKDKYILDNVQFNGCTFKKELSLENINVMKPIFKDWNGFETTMKSLKINNCSFVKRFVLNSYTVETVYLKDTVFTGKFEFTNNIVTNIDVDNCNFEKLAEFYGTQFDKFKMFKSIFTDYTGFEKCKFGKEDSEEKDFTANFQYVTFLSFINFRNTRFVSGLLFEDTNLKESPNFLNSIINFENTSRETFRIIKHSFDKLGNHIEANKYFSLEMKKYKEELSKNNGWSQEKFIFWFNEKISNYGQNYLKASVWLLISSLIYTLFVILSQNIDFINWVKSHEILLSVIKYLNSWFSSIIIFKKILPKNLEFITVIFAILQSTIVWHILVSVRRHSKR